MKKLLISAALIFAAANTFALEISDTFIYNSRFWRNNISVMARPYYPLAFGAEFDLISHKDIDNHVYAIRLPVAFRFGEDHALSLHPFYYPDNANGASAWGGKAVFSTVINQDEVDQSKTRADISAAFATQRADVFRNGVLTAQDSFKQAAYGLNLNFSFFDDYSFDMTGNIYQYLSGVKGVKSVFGVMDQAELADLGTLDYTLALANYTAGIKIGWISTVSRSDNFISYRYIDTHNNGGAHSILMSTLVDISGGWYLSFAYNHIIQRGGKDLYAAGIVFKF